MRTAVADTSIECYRALRRDGGLTRQQHKVLAAVRPHRDYSLQELVIAAGLPVNVISGRVNELKSDKHLVHGPTRKCSITGRTVHPVRLPDEPTQGGLFA
jgi:hypothetical protein